MENFFQLFPTVEIGNLSIIQCLYWHLNGFTDSTTRDSLKISNSVTITLLTVKMAEETLQVKSRKPAIFQLKEGGEFYMIGSEVGHQMGLMKGALYKKFPSLWRRPPTIEERKILLSLNVGYNSMSNSNIMLVKAAEVEKVAMGGGEKYMEKIPTSPTERGLKEFAQRVRRPNFAGSLHFPANCSREVLNSSVQHLNAVSYQTKTSTKFCSKFSWKAREELRKKILPSLR